MEKKKEEKMRKWIHVDLVIEILSRLPVKTLMRLKCLSKEYSRMIQSRNFVDSCLSCSSNRPRLLFYFHYLFLNMLVFFSTPHRIHLPTTKGKAPSRYEMTIRGRVGASMRSPPVRGLILYTIGTNQHVICNPATRQHRSIPENIFLRKSDDGFLILGYDPIFDEFKVLCMSGVLLGPKHYQFWVFTVGQHNYWRKIQGTIPNHLRPTTCNYVGAQCGLCINGILYFQAIVSRTPPGNYDEDEPTHVVKFDLNSEKFSLVETFNPHLRWFSKLIDFQGKLGFISRVKDCQIEFSCLTGKNNNEWSSSKTFHLPWAPRYNSDYTFISNSVFGVCDGEIVFLSRNGKLGVVWHLNIDKNTIRKVEFQFPSYGSDDTFSIHYFANHVDTTVSL